MKRAITTLGVLGLTAFAVAAPAVADRGSGGGGRDEGSDDKVVICHAGSNSGRFEANTVAVPGFNGHDGHSKDIIPPSDGMEYGQNWDDAGKAIYARGCLVPVDPPVVVPPVDPPVVVVPPADPPVEETPVDPPVVVVPPANPPVVVLPPANPPAEVPPADPPVEETPVDPPVVVVPPAEEQPVGPPVEETPVDRPVVVVPPADPPAEVPPADPPAEERPVDPPVVEQEQPAGTEQEAGAPQAAAEAPESAAVTTSLGTNPGYNAQTVAGAPGTAPSWLAGLGSLMTAGAAVALRRRSRRTSLAD
jgi:hypothetical protein